MIEELRVKEIMEELSVKREDAEKLLANELCEHYGTDNFEIARSMFTTGFWNLR